MYIPKVFEENNPAVLHGLIRRWPLGAWVVTVDGEIVVNHVPFLLSEAGGAQGTLTGHVARGNPVWREITRDSRALVVFQGEQAYISPSWYPSKRQDGKSVPTWNYCVVHARGVPRIVEDPAWLINHVAELTAAHEAGQSHPWRLSDAPAGHIEKLATAIVGIEIPITSLIGKWKLGQNRTDSDRAGAIAGLRSTGDARAMGLADLMALVGRTPADSAKE